MHIVVIFIPLHRQKKNRRGRECLDNDSINLHHQEGCPLDDVKKKSNYEDNWTDQVDGRDTV